MTQTSKAPDIKKTGFFELTPSSKSYQPNNNSNKNKNSLVPPESVYSFSSSIKASYPPATGMKNKETYSKTLYPNNNNDAVFMGLKSSLTP